MADLEAQTANAQPWTAHLRSRLDELLDEYRAALHDDGHLR